MQKHTHSKNIHTGPHLLILKVEKKNIRIAYSNFPNMKFLKLILFIKPLLDF